MLDWNSARAELVKLEDYKTILYRQEDGSWVAEVPAIAGCYALMPTREESLRELSCVFTNDRGRVLRKSAASAR